MLAYIEFCRTFATAFEEMSNHHDERAFSSAGSEHLPYKQRVGGSNPSTPTPICGNSSVGRAQPCQGWGREFESRFPLIILLL